MVDGVARTEPTIQVIHLSLATPEGRTHAAAFGVGKIPATYIFDPTGTPLAHFEGPRIDTDLRRTLAVLGVVPPAPAGATGSP